MKSLAALLAVLLLVVSFASAVAVELPVSKSYSGFTVTLLSYDLSPDGRSVVLHGLVRLDRPVWGRLLQISGSVKVWSGFGGDLGYGSVLGSPVDLTPYTEIPVDLELTSPYTYTELSEKVSRIESVYLHIDAQYCVSILFWCVGIPIPFEDPNASVDCSIDKCAVTYDRVLTIAELVAYGQAYGLG